MNYVSASQNRFQTGDWLIVLCLMCVKSTYLLSSIMWCCWLLEPKQTIKSVWRHSSGSFFISALSLPHFLFSSALPSMTWRSISVCNPKGCLNSWNASRGWRRLAGGSRSKNEWGISCGKYFFFFGTVGIDNQRRMKAGFFWWDSPTFHCWCYASCAVLSRLIMKLSCPLQSHLTVIRWEHRWEHSWLEGYRGYFLLIT